MRLRRNRRGQALVETSLVIIALLLMVVAIMDFGQFLFFFQVLGDRARAGARYAITRTCCSSTDIDAIKNMVVFNNPAGSGSDTTGLYGLDKVNVVVTPHPSATDIDWVEVRITDFPLHLLSPYLYKGTGQNQLKINNIRAVRQAEGLGATN